MKLPWQTVVQDGRRRRIPWWCPWCQTRYAWAEEDRHYACFCGRLVAWHDPTKTGSCASTSMYEPGVVYPGPPLDEDDAVIDDFDCEIPLE